MILYLSGPMTGYPDHNKALFADAAHWLRTWGDHKVISPAELDHNAGVDLDGTGWEVDDEQYEQFIDRDLDHLAQAEGIVFLPGWSRSGGAGREGEHALELGMKLYLWVPETPTYLFRMPRWLFTKYRTTNRLAPAAA